MAAHSSYGFSGWDRLFRCLASHRMQQGFDNETNNAAELGTAVHEVVEHALLLGVDCHDFVGTEWNGFEIDEKMADSGQSYVNYIRSIKRKAPHAQVLPEKKVYLSSIDGDELWGTADTIIIDLLNRTLYVCDYKNGYELVDADKDVFIQATGKTIKGNAQTAGYSLASLDTFDLWDKVDKVVTVIGQPNFQHMDGSIRIKEYSTGDLMEWWHAYNDSYQLLRHGVTEQNAGLHCKYCLASGVCKSRIKRNFEILELDDGLDYMMPEQLIAVFKERLVIEKSISKIKEQVVKLARQGHKVPDYKLVRAIQRASITKADTERLVDEMVKKGIDKSKLFHKPKLKGKTDISKLDKEIANKYFVTPEVNLTIVGVNERGTPVSPDDKPDAAKAFENWDK